MSFYQSYKRKNFQKKPFCTKHHGGWVKVDKKVLHLALNPMQEILNNEFSIDFKLQNICQKVLRLDKFMCTSKYSNLNFMAICNSKISSDYFIAFIYGLQIEITFSNKFWWSNCKYWLNSCQLIDSKLITEKSRISKWLSVLFVYIDSSYYAYENICIMH